MDAVNSATEDGRSTVAGSFPNNINAGLDELLIKSRVNISFDTSASTDNDMQNAQNSMSLTTSVGEAKSFSYELAIAIGGTIETRLGGVVSGGMPST